MSIATSLFREYFNNIMTLPLPVKGCIIQACSKFDYHRKNSLKIYFKHLRRCYKKALCFCRLGSRPRSWFHELPINPQATLRFISHLVIKTTNYILIEDYWMTFHICPVKNRKTTGKQIVVYGKGQGESNANLLALHCSTDLLLENSTSIC